jgi:hypothetical protein
LAAQVHFDARPPAKSYTLEMMRLRIGTAIALLLAAQACSFGVDLENLYGQVPSIGADGGIQPDAARQPLPSDGASPADASADADADADAGLTVPKPCALTNKLFNGDFESGSVSPWIQYSSSSTLSAQPSAKRSGNFGLQVVRTGGGTETFGVKTDPLGLTGRYYARLRIRSSGSISTITFGAGDTGLGLAVVPTFVCSEIMDATMTAGSTVYVAASLSNNGPASFDLDDVVLYEAPTAGIPFECTCAGSL